MENPLHKISLFKDLPEPLLLQLLEGSTYLKIKRKGVIFKQDDIAEHFGFVIDGLVKLHRKNPKGQKVIMDFIGPGAIIGGLLMAHPKISYPITAQAITVTQFLKIPQQTYTKYWMKNEEIIRRTQLLNIERMQAFHTTREIQKYPLEQKLAYILLKMCPTQENNLLVRMSRTDLAETTGSCVESVIRIFSQWEKQGLLIYDHGQQFLIKTELEKICA